MTVSVFHHDLRPSYLLSSSHSGHLHIANSEKIQPPHIVGATGCSRDERGFPTTSPIPSSPPKDTSSLVKDHGAEDEYIELDMPPMLESTSDLA